MNERMIKAFRALGSEKRVAVIKAIEELRARGGRPTFDALAEKCGMPFGTLGHHLKVLKEAGLVELDGDGYKATQLAKALMGDFAIISKKILREKLEQAEEMYKATRDERVKAIIDVLKWFMSMMPESDDPLTALSMRRDEPAGG